MTADATRTEPRPAPAPDRTDVEGLHEGHAAGTWSPEEPRTRPRARADPWPPERAPRAAPPLEGRQVVPGGDRAAEADVLLDVPTLKVDEISLEVADLRARVSLNAEVLDLLRLHVGADVALGRVNLGIRGVEAQALLKVRLDNVAAIIRDVLRTIDNNPQLLENITGSVARAVGDVGTAAGHAVADLGSTAGQAVQRLVPESGASGEPGGVAGLVQGAGRAVGAVGGGLIRQTPLGDSATPAAPPSPGPVPTEQPQARPAPARPAPATARPPQPAPEQVAPGSPPAEPDTPDEPHEAASQRPVTEAAPRTAAPTTQVSSGETADRGESEEPHDADPGETCDLPDPEPAAGGATADDDRTEVRLQRPEPGPENAAAGPRRTEDEPGEAEAGPDDPGGPAHDEAPAATPPLGPALRDLGRAARRAGLRRLRSMVH
ncbi:hypothetical protein GCM10010106_14810 [Thermopolyspora flexuosa]|jgi:hypothetical protein|uniref:Uncharacterized protein n=1 Tax=Thermopolyspora flexuosa TaxID=103836 RepID=A0A543IPP8_9ACTN|nr:hypothetical protein [Thermopolyspora flexuosa]TQM72553.1 hypothetical protein FHX40_4700 [Thermopolyspora flexuosa]GGM69633.1 hypothetical protein GCM10010106_14810 [Thermopolyspora flexuosa]